MIGELGISKLPFGYLVADGQGHNLAGVSNFADLIVWMAEELDEQLIAIETPDVSILVGEPVAAIPDHDESADEDDRASEIEPAETEAQDEDEDEDETELSEADKRQPALPETGRLPKNQQKVFDHLQYCAEKLGPRFQLSSRRLAEKAGVAQTSLFFFTAALEKKGLITVESQGRGVDPFYVVHVKAGAS